MKKRKKRKKNTIGGTLVSILCMVLFLGFVMGFGQAEPENPMEKNEADASKMYLITSTLSVDKERLDNIENANINSGSEGTDTSEDEQEKEEETQEQEKKEENKKNDEKQEENKENDGKSDNPDFELPNSLNSLIQKNQKTEDGQNDSDNGNQDGSGGDEKNDGNGDGDGDGGGNIDLNENQSKELFTTSLKNDEVTEESYPFTITLTETGKKLTLVSMNLTVNENSRRCSDSDRITLKEGANKVSITLRFRDSKQNQIDASTAVYTIYYTPLNEILLVVRNYRTGDTISDGDRITVYNENLWLEVTALKATSSGMKPVSTSLRLANQKKNTDSDGIYRLKLDTGEQTLKVTAGESGNNQKQLQCTIQYKIDDFVLNFKSSSFTETVSNNTNLGDKVFKGTSQKTYKSSSPEFGFKVTYSSITGQEKITKIESSNRYGTIDLTNQVSGDGYIYVNLDASQATSIKVFCIDSQGEEQWYTWKITYKRQINEEENNKKAPVIVASLSDGETVNKNPYILSINVYDYNGNNLYPSNFKVYLNGEELDFDGISGGAYEYNLYLTEGKNTVKIKATDNEQYVSEKQLSVTFVPVADQINVHVSVSANVVGIGTLLDEDISVPAGSTVAEILEDRLSAYGYTTVHSGSPTSSNYFLHHIKKTGILKGFQISEEERSLLDMEGYAITEEPASMDSLGELDFTQGSGWMLTLNHYFIGQSAGTRAIRDGDAIALMYTLDVGTDIGVDPNSGVN